MPTEPTLEECEDAIDKMVVRVAISIDGGAPKLEVDFPKGTPEAVCAKLRRVVMKKEKEVVDALLQKAEGTANGK